MCLWKRPPSSQEDNIKVNLREILFNDVGCIKVDQEMVQSEVLVKNATDPLDSLIQGNSQQFINNLMPSGYYMYHLL
jgi:hypothetical protein